MIKPRERENVEQKLEICVEENEENLISVEGTDV